MSTLGKRKEREGEHGSTLFVSNLPYTATSLDIQTLFSDIAPVRSAFVVLEQGGVSKGVGYVSFATREDAEVAFDKISAEGISLLGRELRVQWAEKKPKDKEEAVTRNTKSSPLAHRPHPKNPSDPLAIRTIVISGLPKTIDSKSLWKKFRKCEGAEKVEWPIQTDSGDNTGIGHVLFKSPATAQKAVDKLHAHIFKGHFLSVTLKKRLDSLAKAPTVKHSKQSSVDGRTDPNILTATQNLTIPAPSHASRLIVRNIPFNASEQDLKSVFLPYGPIYSIHIPSSAQVPVEASEKSDGRGNKNTKAGFAFVWMLSKKDAERAIEGCNGMIIKAGMADGMVSDKQKRKKQRREEKKQSIKVEDEGDVVKVDDKSKLAAERVIAVDWALSKGKWEEEKAKMVKEDDDVKAESDSSADESSESESSESDDSDLDHAIDGSGDGGEPEDDDDDTEVKPARSQLPPPEMGTILFVRNVPFTATEDDLRTVFRAFGPLRYTRLTVDSGSGRSRGTGFVCYWNKQDADKVIEQSELLRAETTGTDTPKKNPFTLPSILTPDPSSTLARDLVLQGRTLDVVRAVTREDASKLKTEGEKKREKADKRNMYLLKEGVIMPNSPAAETLSPAEVEKRTRSHNARRQLLKSNPSLYISKVRLSVRQIPGHVTERLLKRLAIHAIRTFEDEVKKGVRVGLTEDELAEVVDENDEEEVGQKNKKGMQKAAGRCTGVKQAKIIRQQERVDPVTGKGRSKGYGFLEMHKHADALRVLRWANNNPDLGPLFEDWRKDELRDLIELENVKETKDDLRLRRMKDELAGVAKKRTGTLIIEFSIENVQVVNRRNALQQERAESFQTSARPSRAQEPPSKKRRVSEETDPVKSDKSGDHIRSVIGRKRKERKMKYRK